MQFRTRNAYYLRISEKDVLPIFLYLDERHLDWMTDSILQHVLADLRPRILPKLKHEADAHVGGPSAKKATVDTHRGDTYQFCYFIRKTEPHSLVIKTRNFVAQPRLPINQREIIPPPAFTRSNKPRKGKRKEKTSTPNPTKVRKKRKIAKGKGRQDDSDHDSSMSIDDTNETNHAGASYDDDADYEETVELDENMTEGAVAISGGTNAGIGEPLEIDEEEKPKLVPRLVFQGFNMYGRCLCVVVEPWPPIRTALKKQPFAKPIKISAIRAPEFTRGKTPLFLPEDNEASTLVSPVIPTPEPVLQMFEDLVDSEEENDHSDGGMMEFSQILNSMGDYRAGAIDLDEDLNRGAFFADAEENKEF